MRKKTVCICILLFTCMLSGCVSVNNSIDYEDIITESDTTEGNSSKTDSNISETIDEEATTSYEDVLARQSYHVGGKISHIEGDDNRISFCINGINVDDGETVYDIGMFMFVNGIPQQFSDMDNNVQYLSSMHIDSVEQTESIYNCEYKNVPEAEKYVCRKNWMLMPDTLVTNQRNFNMGHLQTIGSFDVKHEIDCEPRDNIDVGVIQGKKIKFEESVSNVNILIADAYKGDFFTPTVMERKNVVGEYMLEITPEITGSYIISFWSNGEPIKLGENMFYQVNVETGSKYQYTFELTEELVNSTDNFYAIICPGGMEGNMSKTNTKIFVDEYRK